MLVFYSRPILGTEVGVEMKNFVVVIGCKVSSLERRRRRKEKELCLQQT
jgi:hypothetical protein